jgi:hypothetical protein
MSYTQRIAYEALKSIDSATFTGSYQALGIPTVNPGTIVKMVNNSNVLVTISIDGTNDHDVLPANSFWLYDYTTNAPKSANIAARDQGTQYFVKGAAGVGLVYLVVQHIVVN